MRNSEVYSLFMEIADILDIMGENPFKSRAYRKAAQAIKHLGRDIAELDKEGALETIPGVGKELAKKTSEFLNTGRLRYYEKIKAKVPEGLLEVIKIQGIGPKTAKFLYEKAKVASIEDLEKALREGRLKGLPGLKQKSLENIEKGLESYKKGRERLPLGVVWEEAQALVEKLKGMKGVTDASAAGSFRRLRDTVKDLDLVAASKRPEEVIRAFKEMPEVKEVIASGETKAVLLLTSGLQVDLIVVPPESFGAALVHATGSWAHNLRVRSLARELGFIANEYGIFEEKSGKRLGGNTEEEYYKLLNLPWIPPELRESGAEVDAALEGRLPRLIEPSDIKGDLHLHTKWSDGHNTIKEMAEACLKLGYQYMAITEHSKSLVVGNGLNEERLLKQIEEIRRVSEEVRGIKILTGIEMDILTDGSLDFSDDILAQLDFVIASIHSGFRLDKATQTWRIIKAMQNPHVNLIGHISGRLLGEREAYEVDYDEVFKVAKDTNTHIEINAYPLRMDLFDIYCLRAKELGAPLCITSDAHHYNDLGQIYFGVAVARRGWLTKEEVLNCLDLPDFLKAVRKR